MNLPSDNILVGASTCALAIILSIVYLTSIPFGSLKAKKVPAVIVELRQRIAGFSARIFMAFIFIGTTAIFFSILKEEKLIKNHLFSYTGFVVAWICAGIIWQLVLLSKWKYLNNSLQYAIQEKSDVDISLLRKKFVHFALIILLVGLLLEIKRGFWLLWLFSWLTFVLLIIYEWRIWRSVFEGNQFDEPDIEINKIPTMTDLTYALKYVGIYTFLWIIYIALLIFIWRFIG